MSEQVLDKILMKVVDIDSRLDSFATKEDVRMMKDDIMTTIDRFAKLHETLDHELVAMRSKYERLEERLERLEQKMGFAT